MHETSTVGRKTAIAATISCAAALVHVSNATAQVAEVRCDSPEYIVRVDCLTQVHPQDAVEISKDGKRCAATASEAARWQSDLESAKERVLRQVEASAQAARGRILAAIKLMVDSDDLRQSVNQQYADAESSIKDTIKFTTDLVFTEAAFAEAFAAAVRSLALSKAIDSDPIALLPDGAKIVRRGTNIASGLSGLALSEAGTTVAAAIVVDQLLGPFRRYVKDLADQSRAAAMSTVDKAMAELLMLETISAALGPLLQREIGRTKAYVAKVTPRLDGSWQSTDPLKRFSVQCGAGRCTWVDGNKEYPKPYTVEVIVGCKADGTYLLERPNTEDALVAQGIQPTLRSEVLAQHPQASTLLFSRAGEQLTGRWKGLLVVKKADSHLRELKYPEKDFSFVRAGAH